MMSSCIQNILTTINKGIQKGNNFVNHCFHSKFNINVLNYDKRKIVLLHYASYHDFVYDVADVPYLELKIWNCWLMKHALLKIEKCSSFPKDTYNFVLPDELFANALQSLKTSLSVGNNLFGKLVSSLESSINLMQDLTLLQHCFLFFILID